MPPKKPKIDKLKGLRLYSFLLKQLGEANKKQPKKQRLSIETRRRIVKEELYPFFKAKEKLSIREIKNYAKKVISNLPPSEICNPLYLSEAYLGDVEYYEIDNHIRTLLPDCLDLRINAGQLGKTKIFNTSNYSYYSDGVRRIVETIRNYMASNNSGEAFFNGVVKLKYNKPNNGKAENYYVEYILFINSESELDDTPVDFNLPKKEQKKVAKIRDTLALRLKNLQKEKSKRIRAKKKAQPKKPAQKKQEAQEAVKSAIAALKKLYQNGTITKSEFEAQKAILVKFKKRP
jgi:hypothetical protein